MFLTGGFHPIFGACVPWAPPAPHCNCQPQVIAEASKSTGLLTGLKYAGLGANGTVRYMDGQPDVSGTDLSSDGFGRTFAHERTFSMGEGTGPMGNNWLLSDMPFLLDGPITDPTKPAGATQTVIAVTDSMDVRYSDNKSGTFVQRDGGHDTFVTSTDTDGQSIYTLTDSTGGKTRFFNLSTGTGDDYQFRGYTDADGNTTNVTATDGTGNITKIQRTNAAGTAVDQWDFLYTTVGSQSVISSVSLKRKPNSLSSFSLVRKAISAYYDGTTSGGNAGDLQSVTGRTGPAASRRSTRPRSPAPATAPAAATPAKAPSPSPTPRSPPPWTTTSTTARRSRPSPTAPPTPSTATPTGK